LFVRMLESNIVWHLVVIYFWIVTESGFGADIGLEKFIHIKSRTSGKK
jgi:formyltetrahydrofolate synthetase